MPLSAKPLAALLTSTSEQKHELTAQRAGKRAGLRRAQKCVRQQGRVAMLAVHETSSTQGEYAIVRQAFVSEGTRCGDDLVQARKWSVSQELAQGFAPELMKSQQGGGRDRWIPGTR